MSGWQYARLAHGVGSDPSATKLIWQEGASAPQTVGGDPMAVAERRGAHGWELVSVTSETAYSLGTAWHTTTKFYFKRPAG